MKSLQQRSPQPRHDEILDGAIPSSYDGLVEHAALVFQAMTAVQRDINRIKLNLARSKGGRRPDTDPDWLNKTRHALNCMKLTRECLTHRHGVVREKIKNFRIHRFIETARKQLPDHTFNTIMNATKRGDNRRANA